jgi:hypothetical protein
MLFSVLALRDSSLLNLAALAAEVALFFVTSVPPPCTPCYIWRRLPLQPSGKQLRPCNGSPPGPRLSPGRTALVRATDALRSGAR